VNEHGTHTDGTFPLKKEAALDYLEPLAEKLARLRYPERLWLIRYLAEARTSNLQQIVEAKGYEWDPTTQPASKYRNHLMALVDMGFVSFEREHDGKIPTNVFTFEEAEWRRFCGSLLFLAGIILP